MTTKNASASYLELSSQAYNLFVDAMAKTNQRTLEYMKSVYEISSRPYASTALETTMRENFDRANQVLSLSIAELQTTGQQAVELNEKLVAHGAKLQESFVTTMRGVTETGISNMNFVKDATSQQIDELAKRLDEVQNHATAQVSAN
jgi:hypothetical protein